MTIPALRSLSLRPPGLGPAVLGLCVGLLALSLNGLAAETRVREPGSAEVIEAFAERLAGNALDAVDGWPS